MKPIYYWLAGICVLLIIVTTVTVTRACTPKPPLQPHVTEIVDTVHVQHVEIKTAYRDRIKAVVDTVYVNLEPVGYVASLDTLITTPQAEIETRVDFRHPDQLFTFYQTAKVKTDTTYVFKTQLIETTKTKQNWTAAVIGTLSGFVAGAIVGLTH
jgi:hypothetical protein